jgi:hypothetical protein
MSYPVPGPATGRDWRYDAPVDPPERRFPDAFYATFPAMAR